MKYNHFDMLPEQAFSPVGKRMTLEGGGGGGSKSETTTQLDPTVRPYVAHGLSEARKLYESDSPSYYPNQTFVSPSEQTESALQAIQNRALAGSPLLTQAQSQLSNTIQGGNLGMNPHFANMLASTAGVARQQFHDAMQDINSRASASGRYGSGAFGTLQDRALQNFNKELLGKASELAYGDYNRERQFQEQAIMNAPQMAQADYADMQALMDVGQATEAYKQKALEADIGRFEFEENLPYTKLDSYLSASYGSPAGQVSTTKSSGGK